MLQFSLPERRSPTLVDHGLGFGFTGGGFVVLRFTAAPVLLLLRNFSLASLTETPFVIIEVSFSSFASGIDELVIKVDVRFSCLAFISASTDGPTVTPNFCTGDPFPSALAPSESPPLTGDADVASRFTTGFSK